MLKNNDEDILKDPAKPPSDKADFDYKEYIDKYMNIWDTFSKKKNTSEWIELNLYTYRNQGSIFLKKDKISYFHKSQEHAGTTIHYDNEIVYVEEEPNEVMKILES